MIRHLKLWIKGLLSAVGFKKSKGRKSKKTSTKLASFGHELYEEVRKEVAAELKKQEERTERLRIISRKLEKGEKITDSDKKNLNL